MLLSLVVVVRFDPGTVVVVVATAIFTTVAVTVPVINYIVGVAVSFTDRI